MYTKWGKFSRFWQTLIDPVDIEQEFGQKAELQLLGSTLLLTPLVMLLLFLLRIPSGTASLAELVARGWVVVMALIGYGLCRKGHNRAASWVTIVAATFILLSLYVMEDAKDGLLVLNYLPVVILFGSLFLPSYAILAVFVLQLVGALLFHWIFQPGAELKELIVGPISLNLTFVAMVLVITRHRNLLEAGHLARLAASEMRHRMIAEMISDYAYSCRVDPDETWKYDWVTEDAFERITGYGVGEIADILDLFHPDDQKTVSKDLESVMTGKPQSGEYRLFTKVGEPRWVQVHRRPIWDENQEQVVGFYGASSTERLPVEPAITNRVREFVQLKI